MIASTSLLISAAYLRDASAEQRATQDATLLASGLIRSGRAGWCLHRLAIGSRTAKLLRTVERLVLPGIAAHYRWRKSWIEARAHEALGAGARQMIVLGAGLDPMPARLARLYPRIHVFELDRQAAVALKVGALLDSGGQPANLSLLASDLEHEGLGAPLRAAPNFEPHAPTLVIAEGVAMYLSVAAVGRCLTELRDVAGNGYLLLATAMQLQAKGHPGFARQPAWLNAWLRWRGEPFRWGIDCVSLARAMARHSLRLEALADPRGDPCQGEWLFQASAVHS